MTFIETIETFFDSFDLKQFRIYAFSFLGIVFFSMCFILYRYQRSITALQDRIEYVNRKRKEVKEILERFNSVKKQQAEVDALLAKDTTFKIAGYFDDIMTQLDLTTKKTQEPRTSSATLDNGYTEIRLYASFAGLNTQQLATLLDKLEQNERIYTKEIEIYKPTQDSAINVNIEIATLEPKQELGATTV